jgi:DNA modification methylase
MNFEPADLNTVLSIRQGNELTLPDALAGDDVRFADDLAACFIELFSKPGDLVFDPFAGFGTTLYMAEKLDRVGCGIELLPERAAYIRSIIHGKSRVLCASAIDISQLALPQIDFSITSPPYMSQNDHEEYPFAAYRKTGADYQQYLLDIQDVYRQMRSRLKPGAYAVIEISNIVRNGIYTPLAWDVARKVSEVIPLVKEIVINWQSENRPAVIGKPVPAYDGRSRSGRYGFGFDHSYCLIFRNK